MIFFYEFAESSWVRCAAEKELATGHKNNPLHQQWNVLGNGRAPIADMRIFHPREARTILTDISSFAAVQQLGCGNWVAPGQT